MELMKSFQIFAAGSLIFRARFYLLYWPLLRVVLLKYLITSARLCFRYFSNKGQQLRLVSERVADFKYNICLQTYSGLLVSKKFAGFKVQNLLVDPVQAGDLIL